ncbi:MAG: hypothetical protein U0936_03160 [Planctomycetaceae bacterium]
MSRRSNSSKQKSKAKSAPSSNGSSGFVVASPAESVSTQNEMLAASLLEAIKSVHDVDGVFSDYCVVNDKVLESVSAGTLTLNSSESFTAVRMDADEVDVPCSSADAMATAVLERIDSERILILISGRTSFLMMSPR